MEMDGNQKFDPPGCEELDIPISVGVDHPTTPDVAEAVAHGMATPTSTAHTDVSLDFVRWVSATQVSAVGETGSVTGSLALRCSCPCSPSSVHVCMVLYMCVGDVFKGSEQGHFVGQKVRSW
jgi:hypothetical protein